MPTRMPRIKAKWKGRSNKHWAQLGVENGTAAVKTVWSFLKKSDVAPRDPAVPLWGMYPEKVKSLHTHVHSSQRQRQPVDGRIPTTLCACPSNQIPSSHKKEGSPDLCHGMGKPWGHYAHEKPDMKGHTLCDSTCTKNPEQANQERHKVD